MSTITPVNIWTSANDWTGDTLRDWFNAINTNFSTLNTDKLEASDIAGKQDILAEWAFVDWDKTNLDNQTNTNTWDETTTTIWALINWADAKTTPADTDLVPIRDVTGWLLEKVTWANIKATLKTYFDTLYLKPTESFVIACSDETTALTTWTAKITFRMPYAFTITAVRASLTWAWSTSWTTTVDINEWWTTILSTKLTIDNTEKTSTTATTPAVISDSSLADDAEITIDIDAVTWWADETGLKVYIIWNRT